MTTTTTTTNENMAIEFAAVCLTRTAKKGYNLTALKTWVSANWDSDIVIWRTDAATGLKRIAAIYTVATSKDGSHEWIDM